MLKEDKFYELATTGGKTEEEAYQLAYSVKDRKVLLTALANKRKRDPELFKKITEYKMQVFDKAKEAQQNAVSGFAKDCVLTAMEKRVFLKQMIVGELEMEEVLTSGTKTKRVKRKPTNQERLRALELDNKMAGHFAIEPVEVHGNLFLELLKQSSHPDKQDE
jgi:hypothetical protein